MASEAVLDMRALIPKALIADVKKGG